MSKIAKISLIAALIAFALFITTIAPSPVSAYYYGYNFNYGMSGGFNNYPSSTGSYYFNSYQMPTHQVSTVYQTNRVNAFAPIVVNQGQRISIFDKNVINLNENIYYPNYRLSSSHPFVQYYQYDYYPFDTNMNNNMNTNFNSNVIYLR